MRVWHTWLFRNEGLVEDRWNGNDGTELKVWKTDSNGFEFKEANISDEEWMYCWC